MNIRSVILLVCTCLFGVVLTTEGNTRRYPAPGKQIIALQEEAHDAQDCFEETVLVLTEIHAQRPCRLRSRFTAASSFFIVSTAQPTENISVKDIRKADASGCQQQTQTLPFYYLFLFRLTPF